MSSWMDDDHHLQLWKSWSIISEDPTVGTGQKSNTFCCSIMEHFNNNIQQGKQNRSARTLETKWSFIKHDVNKFIGCYSKVEDLEESGTNEDDMLEKAKNMYLDNSLDSKGKRHQLKNIECWRFLKDKPKWKAYRDKSTPKKPMKKNKFKDATGDEENNDSIVRYERENRPPGIKESKRQEILEAKSKREDQDLAISTKILADAVLAKADAQALCATFKLFTTQLEGMTDMARQFIELQQKTVLNQLKRSIDKSDRDSGESIVSIQNQNPSTAVSAQNERQDHLSDFVNIEDNEDDYESSDA